MAGRLDHIGDAGFRSRLRRVDLESVNSASDAAAGDPATSRDRFVHGNVGVWFGHAGGESGVHRT